MGSRRRLAPIVAALAVLVAMTGPVSAAQWQFVYREAGTRAFAEADATCTENGDGTATCGGTILDVFEGKSKERGSPTVHSERACYSQFSGTFDLLTGEPIELSGVVGCAFDSGTISIKSLRSLTLAATEIDLIELHCDIDSCTEEAAGTVVVRGTFRGVGPITRDKGKFRLDDGICIVADAGTGRFRGASFTGSVDGTPFVPDIAGIGAGTFRLRVSCALF